MQKRVLCLLADGFEEIETVTPVDLLRRAGVAVVLATLGKDLSPVAGRCGIRVLPDAVLNDLGDECVEQFDLLLIPGGPGVAALRADGRPARLAAVFAGRGRSHPGVAAICAAPLVLKDAGLLEGGRLFTAHHSTWEELPRASKTERVVLDGPILTSRGAGTALDFGLALIRVLCGETASGEVARAIMA